MLILSRLNVHRAVEEGVFSMASRQIYVTERGAGRGALAHSFDFATIVILIKTPQQPLDVLSLPLPHTDANSPDFSRLII